MTRKICRKCKDSKAVIEFNKDKRRKDGLFPWCRDCLHKYRQEKNSNPTFRDLATKRSKKWREENRERSQAYMRDYAATHPEEFRSYKVMHLYKLSEVEYTQKLEDQGGICAICPRPQERNLSVDHDHKTGKIRDLLCLKCNSLLGFVDDDIDILLSAVKYLLSHQVEKEEFDGTVA